MEIATTLLQTMMPEAQQSLGSAPSSAAQAPGGLFAATFMQKLNVNDETSTPDGNGVNEEFVDGSLLETGTDAAPANQAGLSPDLQLMAMLQMMQQTQQTVAAPARTDVLPHVQADKGAVMPAEVSSVTLLTTSATADHPSGGGETPPGPVIPWRLDPRGQSVMPAALTERSVPVMPEQAQPKLQSSGVAVNQAMPEERPVSAQGPEVTGRGPSLVTVDDRDIKRNISSIVQTAGEGQKQQNAPSGRDNAAPELQKAAPELLKVGAIPERLRAEQVILDTVTAESPKTEGLQQKEKITVATRMTELVTRPDESAPVRTEGTPLKESTPTPALLEETKVGASERPVENLAGTIPVSSLERQEQQIAPMAAGGSSVPESTEGRTEATPRIKPALPQYGHIVAQVKEQAVLQAVPVKEAVSSSGSKPEVPAESTVTPQARDHRIKVEGTPVQTVTGSLVQKVEGMKDPAAGQANSAGDTSGEPLAETLPAGKQTERNQYILSNPRAAVAHERVERGQLASESQAISTEGAASSQPLLRQTAQGTDLSSGGQQERQLAEKGKDASTAKTAEATDVFTVPQQNREAAAIKPTEQPTTGEREHIVAQVKEKLAQHEVTPGKGEISFTLHPEELGELKISMRMDENRLKVEIFTQNHSVREALVHNIDGLRESLSRQNITVDRFDVSTGGGSFNEASREGKQAEQNRFNQWYPQSKGTRSEPQEQQTVTYWQPRENSLVDVRF